MTKATFILVFCLLAVSGVQAQYDTSRFEFELQTTADQFSSEIDGWKGLQFRTNKVNGKQQIGGYATVHQKFDEVAFSYGIRGVKGTRQWVTSLDVGTSSNGFFNQKFGVSAGLSRKLLPSQRMMIQESVSYRSGRDGHRDTWVNTEVIAWLNKGWIAQMGAQWTHSTPGSADAWSFHSAITKTQPGTRLVSMRVYSGRQAYTIVSPLTIYTDFASSGVSLNWKEFTGRTAGISVGLDVSNNPYFTKTGVSVGFFWTR